VLILLIEPDKVLAAQLAQALNKKSKTEVVIVNSSEQAIAALDESQRFDLIIIEPDLPEHNGLELMHEIRSYSDWQAIPAVFFTFMSPNFISQARTTLELLGVKNCYFKTSTNLIQLADSIKSNYS
jgi:CheY-like chemotaxis protein